MMSAYPAASPAVHPAAAGLAEQAAVDAVIVGRQLRITGQVQGVGFRPFVYQLAHALGLTGDVCNDASGVQILLWGSDAQLTEFERRLLQQTPPMALIESVQRQPLHGSPAAAPFRISASSAGEVVVGVTPDAAVCGDCLAELFDPSDRRYRYPFINCTNCGPRYSLIRQLPYDRPHTTMADFSLCQPCLAEYRNPEDRRFHAQPNACPDCGPQLRLHLTDGTSLDCADPITATLDRIEQGQILAIKGIGGFHLVCDARNGTAVAELRRRKQRDQKPFALMAANSASLRPWVELTPARIEQLQSSSAPIVLCPSVDPQALPGIAPALVWTGVMLPHSPLHYLLFEQYLSLDKNGPLDTNRQRDKSGQHDENRPLDSAADQASAAAVNPLLLVMTSANPRGEPLVIDNDEAFARLGDLADAILLHDRAIHIRCDDSVLHGGISTDLAPVNAAADALPLIRRGRGLAPQVIPLPAEWADAPSVLATGALLKNAVCLTKGNRAYVSQHIGDLDNPSCCRALQQTVEHLCRLFEIVPRYVVHDLHPDNFASQFAQRFAAQQDLPILKVQHHQAHIAAVLAEQRGIDRQQPVLGLALDGFGLGDDGTLWGGELLRLEGAGYRRLARFCPLPLPGGDRAASEPWRMAAAALHQLGRGDEISARFADQPAAATVAQMLERGVNTPLSSSAGRLFDAVAGILGIAPVAGYEAQPAMMLEGLAQAYLSANPPGGPGWPDEPALIELTPAGDLNALPLLQRLLQLHDQDADPGYAAALLHGQLIDALAAWVAQHNRQQRLDTVVLGGGCFLNQLISDGLQQRLQAQGLWVLRAEKLPCNDGGLSLGQAWLALSSLDASSNESAEGLFVDPTNPASARSNDVNADD